MWWVCISQYFAIWCNSKSYKQQFSFYFLANKSHPSVIFNTFNEKTCIIQYINISYYISSIKFVYNIDQTSECITINLDRVRPAMSKHTLYPQARTRSHKDTDAHTHTRIKIKFFAQLASKRICASHICAPSWICSGSTTGSLALLSKQGQEWTKRGLTRATGKEVP